MLAVRALYYNRRTILIAIYAMWALEQATTVVAAAFSIVAGETGSYSCTSIAGPLISLPYW